MATVAHKNTSRRLGKKITELSPQSLTLNENINSKLSLHDLDEKMTSASRKENERKNRTDSVYYICKTTRELFGVRNRSENKACFWIISPLKASKWSQITFCILSNVLSCISERCCLNFEQINIPPRPGPSSFLDRIVN